MPKKEIKPSQVRLGYVAYVQFKNKLFPHNSCITKIKINTSNLVYYYSPLFFYQTKISVNGTHRKIQLKQVIQKKKTSFNYNKISRHFEIHSCLQYVIVCFEIKIIHHPTKVIKKCLIRKHCSLVLFYLNDDDNKHQR